MKTSFRFMCSFTVMTQLISCSDVATKDTVATPFPILHKEAEKVIPNDEEVPSPNSDGVKTFFIKSKGITLQANVEPLAQVRILDYPTEWRGKAKLIRYDDNEVANPFSKEHCDSIRRMASYGGDIFVRTAHHSIVAFEMPFFLTSEFQAEVRDAARAAGISYPPLEIVNPPISLFKGKFELVLKSDSITSLIGDLPYLADQLDLNHRGLENEFGDKEVIVLSGDILCDLAQGNAEMIVTYPIKGEERVVKTVYDLMDLKKK